jgi:nucleoside phosphorylase
MIAPNGPSPLWNVPYQRNPFFTGREDVLGSLHRTLQIENAAALSHPYGISGLGGIGKTQIAVEYAYRYGTEYDAVFWVRADSTAALTSSFMDLAHLLNLPEQNEQDQSICIEAVQRWLRLHLGWLLICDNVDDLSIAEPFLPKLGPGHILFTTRAHALGGIAQRLEVTKMEPETGALLLLRRAGILSLQDLLDRATTDDRNVASTISLELDGLPLALNQAGAYVRESPCSSEDYLARYRKRRQELLQTRGALDHDYPASVATTWSLSFEKVSQANPVAEKLLEFCAFLAPDLIPEELLTAGSPHLGAALAPVVTDPVQLDLACKELVRYSLCQRQTHTRTLTIHRLTQAVLQANLPAGTRRQWEQRVVLAVDATSPNVQDVAQWDACELWLPHALVCATWIEQERMTSPEAAHLLDQAGSYLHERARYAEAEPLYQRALSIREQQLGATHPDTAQSLTNLAELYRDQGRDTEAEPLLQRVLAIYEQQLVSTHPDLDHERAREKYPKSFDVCVVCALSEEARAFLEVVQQQCKVTFEERISPRYYYSYRFTVLKNNKDELLSLHISWLPRYGPQEMILHLSRILEECQPRIVIMTGVCAGDAQQVQLGDLVVAERTFTYDNSKFTRDEHGRRVLLQDTMTYRLAADLLQFLGLFDDWKPLVRGLKRPPFPPQQREVTCYIRAMASASAVRTEHPFEDVQALVRGTAAIDVEGAAFGLVMSRHPLIPWLVVKGVSDYADQNKDDAYLDYAARASALYALSFIRAYVTKERLPQRDASLFVPFVDTSGTWLARRFVRSDASFPEVWNVPRRHIAFFTGRDHLLQQLFDGFRAENETGGVSPQALIGLSGIGKTQTVAEYAYHFREHYRTVLWVRAEIEAHLVADFTTIALLLAVHFSASRPFSPPCSPDCKYSQSSQATIFVAHSLTSWLVSWNACMRGPRIFSMVSADRSSFLPRQSSQSASIDHSRTVGLVSWRAWIRASVARSSVSQQSSSAAC